MFAQITHVSDNAIADNGIFMYLCRYCHNAIAHKWCTDIGYSAHVMLYIITGDKMIKSHKMPSTPPISLCFYIYILLRQ